MPGVERWGTPTTVVADIDSGYRFDHPDLANVAWTNPGEIPENGLDDDGIVDDVHGADFVGVDADAEAPVVDGDPTEDNPFTRGHGVHTAGIIGGPGQQRHRHHRGRAKRQDHAPACLLSSRLEQGRRRGLPDLCPRRGDQLRRRPRRASGEHVARSRSWPHPTVRDAIAANPQTLFVIAAGNESADNEVHPQYPCVYNPLGEGKSAVDNVICVAATDQADRLADFSDWGANTVDLGAPGTQVLSAAPYRYVVKDDFEVDDFASKWIASGPDGGFARTNEAPLVSYGISDSPGATPVAGSTRASTSVPITLAPGYRSCTIEVVRASSGGGTLGVLLDGEEESSTKRLGGARMASQAFTTSVGGSTRSDSLRGLPQGEGIT